MDFQSRRLGRSLAALALSVTALTTAAPAAAAVAVAVAAQAIPLHDTPILAGHLGTTAPTDAQCRAAIGAPCYSPQEIRNAYGLTGLIASGDTGRGQTIVIIDSYGSPTLATDLAQFDTDYGLPAPPSLTVLHPLGAVPFDPTDATQVNWAFETSLDVQWAHALAPGAGIVVLTSPVAETQGVQGLPEFLKLEQYAVAHHLGNIISQSWAATENTLTTPAGQALVAQFNDFYRSATLAGVTFLGSTGDSGTANPDVNGTNYPFPTVNFPSTSPWVTAVGGTTLVADTSGNYQSEHVWNDGAGSATGGGISQIIPEPAYQRLLPAADQKLLAGHRGVPDVAFNADPNSAVLVAIGFFPDATQDGYYFIGGTSEGSPAWAGIVADLNQRAGHPLGFLNPTLYLLGAAHLLTPAVLRDVTVGNNSQPGIAGYSAGVGWDAATGWGTPHLNLFADAFIRQDR